MLSKKLCEKHDDIEILKKFVVVFEIYQKQKLSKKI